MAKEFYIGRRNCAGESLNAGRHSYTVPPKSSRLPTAIVSVLGNGAMAENDELAAVFTDIGRYYD